jgi:hypothetical protein
MLAKAIFDIPPMKLVTEICGIRQFWFGVPFLDHGASRR